MLSPGAQGPRQGSRPCTLAHRHQPGVRRGPASVAHGGHVLTPPRWQVQKASHMGPRVLCKPASPEAGLQPSHPEPSVVPCRRALLPGQELLVTRGANDRGHAEAPPSLLLCGSFAADATEESQSSAKPRAATTLPEAGCKVSAADEASGGGGSSWGGLWEGALLAGKGSAGALGTGGPAVGARHAQGTAATVPGGRGAGSSGRRS